MTAPPGDTEADLLARAEAIQQQDRALGNRVTPWHWYGYEGKHSASCEWGRGPAGAILRMWGMLADCNFEHAMAGGHRPTRVDHQVTLMFDPPDPSYIDVVLEEHLRARAVLKALPTWHYRVGGDGEALLMLGDRSSAYYGRLYDKHAQAPEEYQPGAIRYELEVKEHVAALHARDLLASPNRWATSGDTVRQYFTQRGVRAPWGSLGGAVLRHYRAAASDAIRSLRWLGTGVQPRVRWLCQQGYTREVYARLGLEMPGGAA